MVSECLRCHLPAAQHPVGRYERDGQVSYCVHYDHPAPLWLRLLNRVMGYGGA